MARAGQIIENPITGERITFLKTSAETGGELLRFEDSVKPGGSMPGKLQHTHPLQEERIEVISGNLNFKIRGRERIFGPGETLVVPPGVPHTWWNDCGEIACVRAELRPALGTEDLLETMGELCRSGKTNERGFPSLLQIVATLHEYPDEGGFPRVHPRVQRAIISTLAPLARRRGYRGRYSATAARSTP